MSKYLKYAIGEIILVVLGILIALQINNWNQERLEKKALYNYYQRVHDELVNVNNILLSRNEGIKSLEEANTRSLQILNLKNRDSLNNLRHTIGALGTTHTLNISFPIVDEFLNEGYLSKIKNEAIKLHFQKFSAKINSFAYLDEYIDDQYRTAIEPFFYDKINYASTAFGHNKQCILQGGPKTDYQQFYDDMELWNLLTFKLETIKWQITSIEGFSADISALDSLIVKEI